MIEVLRPSEKRSTRPRLVGWQKSTPKHSKLLCSSFQSHMTKLGSATGRGPLFFSEVKKRFPLLEPKGQHFCQGKLGRLDCPVGRCKTGGNFRPSGSERIRTPEDFRLAAFRVRCLQPLGHASFGSGLILPRLQQRCLILRLSSLVQTSGG